MVFFARFLFLLLNLMSCRTHQSPFLLLLTRSLCVLSRRGVPLPCAYVHVLNLHLQQLLLVVAALALCVALSMFVADKYIGNTGNVLESNSSDEDNIECVLRNSRETLFAFFRCLSLSDLF
jgi:hypothetical protein